MISSCRTSVASVKFLISQNPNIASTFLPGIMGSIIIINKFIKLLKWLILLNIIFDCNSIKKWGPTYPPTVFYRFYAMISDPASPKHKANKEPILMIVFSKMVVS